MSARNEFSILLVDNDPMVARVLHRILHEFTPIRFANSGSEALKLAHESVPDLVLLDVNMPEMNGFDVCKAFKLDAALAQVPIIFVTSDETAEIQARALEFGAADFISKPPQAPLVLARVHTFQRMKILSDTLSETLQSAATMDFLTGTVTRRRLNTVVRQEWRQASRSGAPLSLLLADIEGFTAYNAAHGEDSGDTCLKAVADVLRLVAHRPGDVLGRYAGGKFALLLPQTDLDGARTVAQRAMDAVAALRLRDFASPDGNRISLFVGGSCRDFSRSIDRNLSARGVAQAALASSVPADLIAASEQALESAKAEAGHHSRFVEVADVQRTSSAFTQ